MTLTIHEAARQVGVTEATLRKWVMRDYLTPVRRGAKPLRFREGDLLRCAEERMPLAEHDRLDTLWAKVLAD